MNIVEIKSIIQTPEDVEIGEVQIILKQGAYAGIIACDGRVEENAVRALLLLYCITDDNQVVRLFTEKCSNLNTLMN